MTAWDLVPLLIVLTIGGHYFLRVRALDRQIQLEDRRFETWRALTTYVFEAWQQDQITDAEATETLRALTAVYDRRGTPHEMMAIARGLRREH
jgi:hypothetical protein